MRLFDPRREEVVEFDLWTELDIRSPSLSRASFIPWSAVRGKLAPRDGRRYALPLELEAQYYLCHLATKGRGFDYADRSGRLAHYRDALEEARAPWAERYREVVDEPSFARAAAAATVALVDAGLVARSWRHRLAKKRYKSRSRALARRRFGAVLGPDGCGKTTAIATLGGQHAYRFKRVYRRALLYALLFSFWRRRAERIHGNGLQKNQVDDCFPRSLFVIGLGRAFVLRVRARLGRDTLCDRYFPDLLLQGSRFPGHEVTPVPSWRGLQRWAPAPAFYLQLDARSEIIRDRKHELDTAQIDAFRVWYLRMALADRTPLCAYVANNGELAAFESLMRRLATELPH